MQKPTRLGKAYLSGPPLREEKMQLGRAQKTLAATPPDTGEGPDS